MDEADWWQQQQQLEQQEWLSYQKQIGESMQVYKAICNVQSALSKTGILKNRKNEAQRYTFRGIDDMYNALSPLLAENLLCILPRCIARESVERATKNGGAMFYTTVEAEFDFVSAEDGTKHTVRTFGEAMDSGDKSTNKAMSAAYKYACMQAFSIPTEGDNDADAHSHEVSHVGNFTSHIEAIEEAKTLEELKSAYVAAHRYAAKNPEMLAIFEDAKNARKEQLSTKQEVA